MPAVYTPRVAYRILDSLGKDRLPPVARAAEADAESPEGCCRSNATRRNGRLLQDYFVEHVYAEKRGSLQEACTTEIAKAKKDVTAIRQAAPTTLIFRERKETRRPAYILDRGEYDQQATKYSDVCRTCCRQCPTAHRITGWGWPGGWWIRSNPLTARVTVNRFWQQFFGVGLVKTADDFGSQGEVPSHPKLLDWLAVQFMDDGWDIKATMKRIVMSATYQQTSHVDPSLYGRDPENRSTGPRSAFSVWTPRCCAIRP